MSSRFRTQLVSPWVPWDMRWIMEARANARFIWVRVPGLLRFGTAHDVSQYDGDSLPIRRWERVVDHLSPGGVRVAYAVLRIDHAPRKSDPNKRGGRLGRGEMMIQRWPATLNMAHRLGTQLTRLRNESGLPIGVHCEDFSARWAFDSLFKADAWLLDNPFVTAAEIDDRWTHLKASHPQPPVWLRRSRVDLSERRWDRWRMPFPVESLLAVAAKRPILSQHAYWPATMRDLLSPPRDMGFWTALAQGVIP